MLDVTSMIGSGAGVSIALPGFLGDLDKAGIAGSNIEMCLDAGALESYASGQTWTDLTGNGNDFYRGETSGATASDPTHNGTPGDLSSSEYWTFDGSDWFSRVGGNTTFLNTLHHNNSKFALAIWFYDIDGADDTVCSTWNGITQEGMAVYVAGGSGTKTELVFSRAGSPVALSKTPDTDQKTNAWNLLCYVLDEAGGDVSFFYLGNADANGYNQFSGADTFDGAFTNPSSTNGSTMRIGAYFSNGQGPVANTTRLGMFTMWNGGTLPTKAQFDTFYTSSKVRWGL